MASRAQKETSPLKSSCGIHNEHDEGETRFKTLLIALVRLARLVLVVVFPGKNWSQTQSQTDRLILVLIMAV
jgi:hypothetical protein